MKNLLILCDGMADFQVPELNGQTPMMKAEKPTMDTLAKKSLIGIVKTVPDSLPPGSDTANLSTLGYDAEKCYTGRSPIEALSLGITLSESDIAMRCNFVTLSDEEPFENKTMVDYSAGELSTEESKVLIEEINAKFGDEKFSFYPGTSYRNCLVIKNEKCGTDLTPPHDISKKKIGEFLPKGNFGQKFIDFYKQIFELLKNHPINVDRKKRGKNPANCIWLWGEGTKPNLQDYKSLYHKNGAVISAVDLIKGLAIGANLQSIDVEGVNGTLHTNFEGKAEAAINAFEQGKDFVFVHLEAPDECGHQGDVFGKVKAIELIDKKILKPILSYLESSEEIFKILIMPDHYTPLTTLTHDRTPVPFLMYQNNKQLGKGGIFTEIGAKESKYQIDYAPDLIKMFFEE